MVDVSAKRVTLRRAVAVGEVRLSPRTLRLIAAGRLPKGDAIPVARLAGIMAAKRTDSLIPLCHPLGVEALDVQLSPRPSGRMQIRAEAVSRGRTGVEMEALVAVAAAALTLYDMCKSVERGIEIGPILLLEKSGGRSGRWRRD
jgi:cyclic pyranopterin phosphate synthase